MDKISKAIITMHGNLIEQTYECLGWTPDEIDHLVCHQVGRKPHQRLVGMTGIEAERAPVTYRNYGNITSATIPFNLHLVRPTVGDKLLLLGTGSGLSISQVGLTF
ncbi:3-oxoacyl-[acyl-carrier-protein] synthase III C-terminal domain-containing protein [Motiliproteus sp. MSK22-1]|uniref:3-oxoacyl-[acyl-carrier-protein] synthase III C-terminal domain-containing protein n=1 Tax=Motiliproteus sp. MSK22-1 TaxID=1897630 RepID=UPI0018E93CD1|nr:3-oxoacyl-[acyl-carrier-protein] synthase III C-terminal domain-containing protein [Motiliproteus sp. MSK22-1]